MCGVARKIIAVVGTERMLSNSGGNDQRPYMVRTVYVRDVRTFMCICIQYYLACIYTTISATTINRRNYDYG